MAVIRVPNPTRKVSRSITRRSYYFPLFSLAFSGIALFLISQHNNHRWPTYRPGKHSLLSFLAQESVSEGRSSAQGNGVEGLYRRLSLPSSGVIPSPQSNGSSIRKYGQTDGLQDLHKAIEQTEKQIREESDIPLNQPSGQKEKKDDPVHKIDQTSTLDQTSGHKRNLASNVAEPEPMLSLKALHFTLKSASRTASLSGKTARKNSSVGKSKVAKLIPPTPRGDYHTVAPDTYRGLYLNNRTVHSSKQYEKLISKMKKLGMNTLVVDVQPRFPDKKFIKYATENGIYPISRIVVFDGGLKSSSPNTGHLKAIVSLAEKCARSGFAEVQLDYIRYADKMSKANPPLKERYMTIGSVLQEISNKVRPLGVRTGADIFGRIAYNREDTIGQKLELFADHMDTIYPMLYPSHFFGQKKQIRDPYGTVYHGIVNSLQRVQNRSRIVAYIQGFKMDIGPSGLSLKDYIRKQLEAVDQSGGDGYIVWNASNHYAPFFSALKEHLETEVDLPVHGTEEEPEPSIP